MMTRSVSGTDGLESGIRLCCERRVGGGDGGAGRLPTARAPPRVVPRRLLNYGGLIDPIIAPAITSVAAQGFGAVHRIDSNSDLSTH